MDQVTHDLETKAWNDDDLDYLLREWRAIPQVAAEWDQWDELDRLVFVVEWPLRVDRQKRLEFWSEQHELSPRQQVRYCDLLQLISLHQETLDRLLAE